MPEVDDSSVATSAIAPATVSGSLSDGVYLYGQSPKPDEIGQSYFVFEVAEGRVLGALYMPSSSFDCAVGNFQQGNLALTVRNSYDRTTHAFNIPLERTATVASNGAVTTQIGLQGFHRLDAVSQNDLRILGICKSALK